MPMWNKIFVQNSNSPLMEHLSFFHDHSMIILISMTIITLLIMISCLYYNNFNRFFLEIQTLELFWTSLPALMLIFIAFPSLKTLYLMEENLNPLLSIKTMGLQWYWTYEYFNISNSKFNSLLLNSNLIRLLNSSSNLIIPNLIPTRMLISSKDVIHSWTIPSLGVKSDAMPGRMNQIFLMIKRPTILVGQCSEICGAGHSFMPILLEVNSNKNFMKMI